MIIDAAAYNQRRDALSYPPIPDAAEFWTGWAWQVPLVVHGWDWSVTFGRWSALVEFDNGGKLWTYPRLPSQEPIDDAAWLAGGSANP